MFLIRSNRLIGFVFMFLCLAWVTAGSASAASTPWSVVNGMVYSNGKPVFPRGFYYVSHYQSEKAARLQALSKIAQAGYNFMATPIDGSDKPFLDAAAANGVNVAIEFNADPASLLKQFGTHPALAWQQTFDDVDAYTNGKPRYSPATVANESSYLKSLAPNTLTYVSGGYPKRILNYLGITDLMGFQSYPIPYEPLSSVTLSYLNPILGAFRTAKQPFISNLQTFAWDGTARWPTNIEVRNMTYQALAAGVQGILYYTYYDTQNTLAGKTLWNEMVRIGSELKTLEPFLLSGTHRSLATGKSESFAASWKVGKDLVVVVVNVSDSVSKTISLSLNENLSGTITNLFPNRAGKLALNGKTLSGTLPKRNVQVYKLGLR